MHILSMLFLYVMRSKILLRKKFQVSTMYNYPLKINWIFSVLCLLIVPPFHVLGIWILID